MTRIRPLLVVIAVIAAIGLLVIAALLVWISQSSDGRQVPMNWTFDEEHEYFLTEWKDAGGGEMSTWGIPESVLKQFDIKERTITPEVFFSREFQKALRMSGEPFTVMRDPSEMLRGFDSALSEDNGSTLFIENEKRRMAVLSRLRNPDDLPPEVLEGLEQYRFQIDRMNSRRSVPRYDLRDDARFTYIPVDEAFSKLHPTDQERLEPYREQLSLNFFFSDTFRHMTTLERQSAYRLRSHMERSKEHPFVLPPEVMTEIKQVSDQGYRLKPNELARTTLIRQQIERSTRESLISFLNGEEKSKRILPIDSSEGKELIRNLSPVPEEYILSNSDKLLVRIPPDKRWRRYYSKSVFGGALLVDETEATDAHVFYPNLEIAGHDALILYEQYKNNHWVTTVTAFNGMHLFHFLADGKLEDHQKEDFLEFCRTIAETIH